MISIMQYACMSQTTYPLIHKQYYFIMIPLHKRYSKIDQHLSWHFKYNGGCLSSPPPFLWSQIITPFSNSMISTNQETGL